MRSDVQVVVDRLARELGRSVTLKDVEDEFVTYAGPVDATDNRRREWILTQGKVSQHEGSLWHLEGHPGRLARTAPDEIEPGSMARVLGVIRDDRGLLGGLSVIDAPIPLASRELELLEAAADELSVLMRRDLDAEERRTQEQVDLVRSVLSGDADARREAIGALVDRELLASLAPCSVVVAALCAEDGGDALNPARRVLRESLQDARIRHGVDRSLAGVLEDKGVLVLLGSRPDDDTDQAAGRLLEQLSSRLQQLPRPVATVVAASDPQPGIEQAHIAGAQASRVCRIACTVGGFDCVVTSDVVGVYDVLAQLPDSALTQAVPPAGLQRLLDRAGDRDILVPTLECYLDNAGNAAAAAQQLLIHRGTLYYRLERIEDITGVELRDGLQRMSLHLGIKLARLAGIITDRGVAPTTGRTSLGLPSLPHAQ